MLLTFMFFGGFAACLWGYTETLDGKMLLGETFQYQEYIWVWLFLMWTFLIIGLVILFNYDFNEEVEEIPPVEVKN